VPHIPQERGLPEQKAGAAASPPPEEKADSFFVNFFDPHFGQGVRCQRVERTRISLSAPHFSQ
jgi:hypothetical protein